MKYFSYILCILCLINIQLFFSQEIDWDFENQLLGWNKSDMGAAFDNQPTFGNTVTAIRIRPEILNVIGGDYWWETQHPIGHHGEYWIGTFENHPSKTEFGKTDYSDTTGNLPTGILESNAFIVTTDCILFLLGGTGGRVELVTNENILIDSKEPDGIEIMSRCYFDVRQIKNKTVKIRIVDDRPDAHINVDNFVFSENTNSLKSYEYTTSYSDLKKYHTLFYSIDLDTGKNFHLPLWGFADTHAHWMNNVGFSGNLVHGSPYGEIDTALRNCDIHHSKRVLGSAYKYLNGLETGKTVGSHEQTGYPDFTSWPNFRTKTHQAMYIDWVKRAYWGGLRVMVCQLSNNEALADVMGNVENFKDLLAVEKEYKQLKEMVAQNSNWMEIAKNSEDIKRINFINKLAIVVGMEIDKPYNWGYSSPAITNELEKYVNHIYNDWDVRYYFPVHIADNAFGGFALYGSEQFCVSNTYLHRGMPNLYVDIESNSQVTFGLGRQRHLIFDHRFFFLSWRGEYTPPGYGIPFKGKSNYTKVELGHINKQGLTDNGRNLVSLLMKKGMIIDIDHMGFKTTDGVLHIAETNDYPLIAGHTNFLDQMLNNDEITPTEGGRVKLKNEHAKNDNTLKILRKIGGILSPITEGDKDVHTFQNGQISNDNPGSSKTWAQTYLFALDKNGNQNVALGTDFNGFATEICPRFGSFSAYSLKDDLERQKVLGDRKKLANEQYNGIKYESQLQDTRSHKFSGDGVYSSVEKRILQSIYVGYSSVEIQDLDLESSFRGLSYGIRDALDTLPIGKFDYQDRIGRNDLFKVAGYVLASQRIGIIYNRSHFKNLSRQEFEYGIKSVEPIYQIYDKTIGNNYPLKRCIIPTENGLRDFDFNIDGLAHYGMLPDFFQDLKNIGLNGEYLSPLFLSAGDFMRMWSKCEINSKNIK